ncbi:MAG: riboflavin synthase, partial [Actinomycetota bacterium]
AYGDEWFAADAVDETLSRSALRVLSVGDPVNLERPVRLIDRLGGHLVQGHVDGIGTVRNAAPDLAIGCEPSVLKYVVEKGSITVDGISLTVVEVGDDGFTVAVIPHTITVTTLGQRKAGDLVNLEVDVVAKYVERLLTGHNRES